MNFKRSIYILAILLIVGVSTVYVGKTYSRFEENSKTSADTNVAKWDVVLKDKSTELTNQFNLKFVSENANNENVAKNKIAPGVSGKASLILDFAKTEVSVDYNITVNQRLLENDVGTSDITLQVVDNENNPITLGKDVYVPLENKEAFKEENGIVTINFILTWNNSESNNVSDTEIAEALDNLDFSVFVKIKQHVDDSKSEEESKKITSNISYSETTKTKQRTVQPVNYTFNEQDVLSDNPEKGFYSTSNLNLNEAGKNGSVVTKSGTNNLLYVSVDLSAFSKTTNGVADKELTTSAINALDSTLNEIKQNNNTAILRFRYDNHATGIVDGVTKFEPEQTMLLKHISQLAPVFKKYSDTIDVIQTGFYGLWGEDYYNTDVQSHPEYIKQTVEALLNATSGTDITIAVRTPKYYTNYRDIDINNIVSDVTTSSEDAYRVGIFNDGYGGDATDLGTYQNREKEVTWLNNQSSHTFYGGEAIVDASYNASNPSSAIGEYNTAMKFIEEAFKLHTSYLNWEWNQALHQQWALQTYTGDDKEYYGKSALTYIENHLGYRLVLKEAKTYEVAKSQTSLPIDLTVENVGFANLVKKKQADIVLTDDKGNVIKNYENVDINAKDFLSRTSIKKSINIDLPGLSAGKYNLYLRLSNGEKLDNGKYYSSVMFANDDLYDDNVQANYIATFMVD